MAAAVAADTATAVGAAGAVAAAVAAHTATAVGAVSADGAVGGSTIYKCVLGAQ